MIEDLSKVHFKCNSCENEFFIDTVRLASSQEIVCNNCGYKFENQATTAIGKALKGLYEVKNVNFTYWFK